MESTQLLTVAQLAKTLNVSRRHIYRLILNGMPKYTIGKTFRFNLDDVLGWAKCQKN